MLFNEHQQDIINRALDGPAAPEALNELDALLSTSEDLALWEAMQDVDHLLRTAPIISPSRGFTAQVMAKIYAEPLPRRTQAPDGTALVLRLTLFALVGIGLFLAVRFAIDQFIGPLPTLEEVVAWLSYFVRGTVDVIEWLAQYLARYPMLPAIGVASIPLAFAATWLIVYYTPKEPLRRAAHYLTA